MRLIQATVPPDARADVDAVLAENDYEHFATAERETEQYAAIYYVPTPDDEVQRLLADLKRAGLGADDHVVILDTEADIFGKEESSPSKGVEHAGIAAAELEAKVDDILPEMRTFLLMMVLSAIVATTGLLLDSAAVVVGSMVLAPLFGPAVSTSVGTVMDKPRLFRAGIKYQVLGIVVAIITAISFAWLARITYLVPTGMTITATPQIVARLSPDLLSLVVAFIAGIAGVLSIATGAAIALVGVMMAAALLPPAATVGIGVAWGEPLVAANSGILLAVNVLAINLAGLGTLWYLGYRPQTLVPVAQTRRALLKRSGVLIIAVAVTSVFLMNVTYASAHQSQLENSIETDIREVLGAEQYANVTLINVKVVEDKPTFFPTTERVVVTVGRPPGESHPELQEKIDKRVTKRINRDVPVSMRVSLMVAEGRATNTDRPPSLRAQSVRR